MESIESDRSYRGSSVVVESVFEEEGEEEEEEDTEIVFMVGLYGKIDSTGPLRRVIQKGQWRTNLAINSFGIHEKRCRTLKKEEWHIRFSFSVM